jgi:amino acid transporter
MKTVFSIIPWLILALPFVILSVLYNSIPNEVLIARSFFGDDTTFAPKTLFTVFRVPLIEIVCAAAIEIMRRKVANENADYYAMWSILLWTVALKSLLQAFEIASSAKFSHDFFYATFIVVFIGIILALFKGRRFFSDFFGGKWKFSIAEKAVFVFILIAYLGLAIVPIFVFK